MSPISPNTMSPKFSPFTHIVAAIRSCYIYALQQLSKNYSSSANSNVMFSIGYIHSSAAQQKYINVYRAVKNCVYKCNCILEIYQDEIIQMIVFFFLQK